VKFCFVSDFYSPSIGGTQVLSQQICESFLEKGHQVEVVTSCDSQRKEEQYNYKIFQLENLNFQNSSIFRDNNYDTVFVLADLFSPTLLTINTGEIKNSVLILNLDENVYSWYKSARIPNIDTIIEKIKSYTSVVSFCKGAPVNKFLEENKIKYSFIPNFSRDTRNTKKLDFDIKEKLKIEKNKKIIFNHGLIEERKNQLYLCEVFSNSSLIDDYVLILLGSPRGVYDNIYLDKINKIIEEKKLQDSIKIVKGTSNKSIIDTFLDTADIFVLPSKAEGLPLVLLEAMSSNLPWISTPVGGVPQVFRELNGGKVLKNINFSSLELEKAVNEVSSSKSSRKEWEENFTKNVIIKKYEEVVNLKKKYIKNKKMKISFANQVYNEPQAIDNYLSSCLQFSDILDEVFIINHRSSDNTLQIIENYKQRYDQAGIKLRWETETRDFSKDFTIADLFGNAVEKCENEIVFRHDADFIFGESYRLMIEDAVRFLTDKKIYACGYEIPVVSQFIENNSGVVTEHGPCYLHVAVPRVFKKSKTVCLQNHVKGKYEWFYPKDKECASWKIIPLQRQSILSVNIKDKERMEIRKTMNTFFEDIYSGKVTGKWLQQGSLRKEEEEQNKTDSSLKKINIVGDKFEW